jgi:hypothetical protein
MLISLACNISFWRTATPEYVIPVTTEAVESLEETAQWVFQEAQTSGEINLVISEAQLTSIFTFELEERVPGMVNNMQLFLRDGQIQMTGDISSESISAPVKAILEVRVDPLGRPILNVLSANIGPLPVPGDLVSEVEAIINQAFQNQIKSMAPEMFIEKIVIENGKMAITGRAK